MPSKRWLVCLCGLLVLFCTGFGPPVLTNGDVPLRRVNRWTLAGMGQPPAPEITAASAFLYNPTTRQVIYTKNPHSRRAPGSLSKIVTAMVAIESEQWEKTIVIREEDLAVWSMIGMAEGEEHSLLDLLYLLLIPSDNAAAQAIARGLAGDVDTFVGWMNERVSGWGLQDTRFANPTGLDDVDNYTSAYDIALIAERAMRDPVFAAIVGNYEINAAGFGLKNTNEMLVKYEGTVGVKTGTTDQAGECLVTMVKRPQGDALCVVMGSEDRYKDSSLLLDYFYDQYTELHVDLPETPQNRYVDQDGAWHSFGLQEPIDILVESWQVDSLRFVRDIHNPATQPAPDEAVGTLIVYLNDQPVLERPLYVR